MTHFDGKPFVPAASFALAGKGRVAVDSCAQGVHALLELEIDANNQGVLSPGYEQLPLWRALSRMGRLRRVTLDGPICGPAGLEHGRDRAYRVWQPTNDITIETEASCSSTLRAEFELNGLPSTEALASLRGLQRER